MRYYFQLVRLIWRSIRSPSVTRSVPWTKAALSACSAHWPR